MTEPPKPAPALSREDRLAAKLRENLRRRKAQARALEATDRPDLSPMEAASGSRTGGESPVALSKPDPSR